MSAHTRRRIRRYWRRVNRPRPWFKLVTEQLNKAVEDQAILEVGQQVYGVDWGLGRDSVVTLSLREPNDRG